MKSDDGVMRALFATPEMAATLVSLALGGVATYYAPAGMSIAACVLIGLAVGYFLNHRESAARVREAQRSQTKLKKEHAEVLGREERVKADVSRKLASEQSARKALEAGTAAMLDSLQSVAAAVQQLGPHPDKNASLNVIANAVRLASGALSLYAVGAGEDVVVCAKRLVLKRDDEPWACRLAIWPAHEGDTDFPIAQSRPLEVLVTQRVPYFFVANAEESPGLRIHAQFQAMTILVTPITIRPGWRIGFLWVSSDQPAAFDADTVFNYTKALGYILAPLFDDEYVPAVSRRAQNE